MSYFNFDEELHKLPHEPGVYIMHDIDDTVIYVGKAKDLHSRVRSYFRKIVGRGPAIDKMVSLIDRFEYIVTDSELEALVLENNLIKEHSPKYNTLLKDDKTYPYIKVTLNEEFPRVLVTRQVKKDKAKYFGPYSSAFDVNNTVELVNKLFKLRTCNKCLKDENDRECLNYHLGQCSAPCCGKISKEEYAEHVNEALLLLSGEYKKVLSELKEKMNAYADELQFEEAAKIRDYYNSVLAISEKQKITAYDFDDKDIVAAAIENDDAVVQVFFVREGKLIGREHHYMTHVSGKTESDILLDFVKQFYAGTPFVPREIMLSASIDDIDILEQFLSQKKGARVHILIPQIGQKEKLVELCKKNAGLVLQKDKERIKLKEAKTIGAVHEIENVLGIPSINRMEAFDISNISGFLNVGSMVVFEKGEAKKSDYRKFKIRSVAGPNDYACMKEVLERRFLHGLSEKEDLRSRGLDNQYGSFTKFPDLLLMDGGKGQVNIAKEVLEELHLNIPVCGMVKDDNHNTRGLYYENVELPIDTHSEGFKLITRIQDEAHRFAIEYHRSLRGKSQIKSSLDDIPGVGPSRKKALMRAYDSIEDIKKASVEELSAIDGITEQVAQNIVNYYAQ